MSNLSLGTIEVLGLPAAVEAADVALKTANVKLIGYETTDGMGMVAVKIEGQVSAVISAVAAARAAAERITKVFAVSVIARPSAQLSPVVLTDLTVGLDKPAPPVESPSVAPVETTNPADEVSTSSTGGESSSTSETPPAPGPDASAKPADVPADQADVPAEPADAPSGPPAPKANPPRSRGRKAPAAS